MKEWQGNEGIKKTEKKIRPGRIEWNWALKLRTQTETETDWARKTKQWRMNSRKKTEKTMNEMKW